MNVDLADAYERVTAARDQVGDLTDQIWKYVDSQPLLASQTFLGDGRVNLTIEARSVPPSRLWITASHLVNDLRAALDNSVHAIATAAGGDEDDRSRKFPIVTKQQHYWGVGGKKGMRENSLRGVPAPYRKVIDAVQPFNHGKAAEHAVLRVFADFNNTDKHQNAHRAFPLIFGADVAVDVLGIAQRGTYVGYNGPTALGPAVQLTTSPAVRAQFNGVKVGVGFGARGWQVADIARTVDVVDAILLQLARVGLAR